MVWKSLEAQREWRAKTPEKQRAYAKRDWKRTKSNSVLLDKKHKHDKECREKNIEFSRQRERISSKKYRLAHPDRRKISCKKWELNNPEKILIKLQRHLKKISRETNLRVYQFTFALRGWSSFVRNRDSRICQVCGRTAKLSHHIIHKVKYPKLALNMGNGISLCDKCHNEVHGKKLITLK